MLSSRRLMGSTDQADPMCFYFRISWILMERLWFYFFFVPSTCCRASEASKIDYFKNWVWTFWTKNFNSSLINGCFGAIIFQEIEFFEHLKCNFKTSWPQKISIFKKHFTAKITLVLMIKKCPYLFPSLKIEVVMTYFMLLLLRPCTKWRGQKK